MGKNRKIKDTSPGGTGRWREVGGIVALGVGVFLALALISLLARGQLMGPFGRGVATLVYGLLGFASFALVGVFLWIALRSLLEKDPVLGGAVAAGTALGALAIAVLAHLVAAEQRIDGAGPGGALGEHVAEILRALISTTGTALLATVALIVAIVVATPLRMRQVLGWIASGIERAFGAAWRGLVAALKWCAQVAGAILPERDTDEFEITTEELDDDVLELGPEDKKLADPPIIVAKHAGGDTHRTEAAPPP